jgi:hypothetical protein
MIVRADAVRLPFRSRQFDLVVGSPPYIDARLYLEDGEDLGIARDCRAWVEWMLLVTTEALRVSKGLVLWVVAGKTEDWCYQPGPEGLLWRWWERGGECHCFRPCYWHRVGIPGSGTGQWFRADVEYVLAFKRPGRLPYANPIANGHAPKWAPGGEMSHRGKNGTRKNAFGVRTDVPVGTRQHGLKDEAETYRAHTKRFHQPDGTMEEQSYTPPVLANPGNLIHTTVGGNQLGSSLSHDNEAPYPEDVPAFFINSHVPPGGLVLDPFSGSGSTIAAALSLGRRGVGCDLRQSQCVLGRKRTGTVTPGFVFSED